MGTCKAQQEAVIIFDFHFMIVQFKWTKFNDNYSANNLIKMIKNFKQNSNEFDANQYLWSIY